MAGPLAQEHGYLGASIEDGRVISYLDETPLEEACRGVALYDLTGALYRFVSGDGARSFVEALSASKRLAAGSCSFSAVLSGDGALISIPLVIRGGEREYMLIDAAARREILGGWMDFVAAIEEGGMPAFAGTAVEDADALLVPLLLCGARAGELISDYIEDQLPPEPGSVATVAFDGVPCVLAHLDRTACGSFVVFVPPSFSPRLFRSFLSFDYVHPQGHASLSRAISELPWGELLAREDRVEVDAPALASWDLLRPDADYIGARGLRNGR